MSSAPIQIVPGKKTMLFLTSRFPFPLDKGDKLRAFHQIKALSVQYNIILCSINDDIIDKKDLDALLPFTTDIYVFSISFWRRILNIGKAILSNTPFQVAWFYSPFIHNHIKNIANTHKPDICYIQLARMAPYVNALIPYSVLDYMDAFGLSMAKRALLSNFWMKKVYNLEAKRMIHYEAKVHALFSQSFIISSQDQDQMMSTIASHITVLPNGIDTQFFQPQSHEKLYDIAFIGNMSYLPNIEAAKYLAAYIFPLLEPNTKIAITGATPDMEVQKLQSPNINIKGWVEDIRIAYASSKIFVAPIFSGTGQQNKILEAMAMGIPVVTTSSVANAILAHDDIHLLIADDASEFSDKIKLLLNDQQLHQNLSQNALHFVKHNYNWKQILDKISL